MTDIRSQLQASLGPAYSIERELGGGGMSRVFLATDARLERQVVVKVLSPELAATISVERFAREIKLAAQLQEPHIVPVLIDGVTADGLPYYVMPFVAGASLRQRMMEEALPTGDAIGILGDVAKALAYAHSHGVVHRDIKPENILLSSGTGVVTDFGIAKAVSAAKTNSAGSTLTSVGTSIGTPAYMAPEQAAGGEVDHRADIYSWGVVAYELLSGAHPFAGKTTPQQLIAAHIAEVPKPLSTIGTIAPPLAALVARCLEKDAALRPQSASELAAGLAAVSTVPVERPLRSARGVVSALVIVAIIVTAAVAGRGWWGKRDGGRPPIEAPGGVQSIAVLPFENVGGDTAQEYFADGMTQEISSVLAKIPGLRVAGRRSAFAYKGTATPIAEIGRALGVTLALEGRVRREGGRVRVSVELSNAADGMQRWTGKWDADLRDAFHVQDSLAQAIARELRLVLSGTALAASRAGRTPNPAAHDLYLRGRSLLNLGSQTELRRSIVLFQQAIAIDPTFAQAHAGVANAWAFLADAHVPASEAYPQMRDAALAALGHDSLLAEAHTMYGYALLGTNWDYATAGREMRRGLDLDPNSHDVSLFYSNFLCARGRTDEGLEIAARAVRLEPLSAFASWNREWCFYTAHRWDEVIAQHRITDALDSTLVYLDAWHAGALREQGRLAESLKEYERAQRLVGDRPLYGLAITYSRLGDTAAAKRLMRDLEARAKREYVSADALALGWAGIGEVDRAFYWLSRAIESRSLLVTTLEWFPEYEGLRGDPRYQKLLARLNGPR